MSTFHLATTRARDHAMSQQAASKTIHARPLSLSPALAAASANPFTVVAAPQLERDASRPHRSVIATVLLRNLADALGISESKDKTAVVTYHPDLVAFARLNGKFVTVVEKAFDEFFTSQKKTQILPQMPPERREFVRGLAAVYRMDTQMIDQEPNRSVRLLRRIDTRIPTPLLSSTLATPAPAMPSLGKLADLRTSATPSWRVASAPSAPKPSHAAPGWGSRPASAASKPSAAQPSSRPTTSATVTRVSSPALPLQSQREDGPTTPTIVPDSWEDDL
ncbi:hypothetical protein DXG01_001985 [Tephrocybe rancida]|nr:hypothetical protein DXG01_001985 [Tephrocybe rancida]